MYDFVNRNKFVVQIILGLMILPFAFFGVDSYFRTGGKEATVATVGGEKITQQEYENALRDQQARYQQMLGANFRPEMFDTPEARKGVLDGLINQRLIEQQSRTQNFAASDAQLQKTIAGVTAFQDNGVFSEKRYVETLSQQGMSPLMYEQRLRQALAQQPIQDAVATSTIISNTATQQWLNLFEQTREITVAQLDATAFLEQTKVSDEELKAYYDKTPSDFQSPEQVKVEYLILAQSSIANQVTVTAEEVKKAYEDRSKEFATPEERKASHILIASKADAKTADKDAAKKKATDLLATLKTSPEKFAELAKANSDDPGSKETGGDLGYFGRGAMVKPFETAAFDMKVGELRGPIETDFGFHIIKVTETKGGTVPPLEDIKPKIEADLKNRAASKKFGELAEKFQKLAYEQSDSYKTFAAESKLNPVSSQWLTRAQLQAIALGNKKLPEAVWAKLTDKTNTEAMEVATNTLMSARVLEHKVQATRSFDEVKGEIASILKRKQATALALKAGQDKLAAAQAGNLTDLKFGEPVTANRQQKAPGVSDEANKLLFAAADANLPQYIGAANDRGGYSIIKLSKINAAPVGDAGKIKSAQQRLNQQLSGDTTTAYLAALKLSHKVAIEKDMEKKTAEADKTEKSDKAAEPAKK
jgi:peptidyl-prolyl cis-trans isomerase D